MSVAATRNCCAALMPMPKISMPTISADDAVQQHREPDDDRADQRQPEAEQDAGLAAVGVGDLADRIGHQEPADAEQRRPSVRRGSPSR